MRFEHRKRGEPELAALLRLRLLGRPASGEQAEAQAADPWHHVGLLEDQPLEDVRAFELIVRQKLGSLGEEPEDRVRFLQIAAVIRFEDGSRARRILRRELVGERVAAEDVDRNALVRAVELRKQEARLVAVRGRGVIVEPHDVSNVRVGSAVRTT